jgi:phosphatidylcholine synthase
MRGVWAAALVHVFTALGVVCALFAAVAMVDHQWERFFVWLGVALFIDGVDGSLARIADVKAQLPRFSGERLDLVIDYVTYVFLPALAMLLAGFLPGWLGLVLASLVLLSSLFHFSDTQSKAGDHSFIGFPAIWNAIAFYVFAFQMSPTVVAVLVLIFVILTFVPMHWAHPMRTARLWPLTIAAMLLGATAAFEALQAGFPASGPVRAALAAVAAYGIGLTLLQNWRS